MKYKYLGNLSAEKIDGQDIIFTHGKIYDFKPDLKRIQTLVKLGLLEKINEKQMKKGQK